jgi:hypothetical protein
LYEEIAESLVVSSPEFGDRPVVRLLVARYEPEGHIFIKRFFDLS